MSSPGQGALWEPRPRFLSGTSLQRCHRSWPDVPCTSMVRGFGLGRGCFGREGVQSCTGSFPERGGAPRPKPPNHQENLPPPPKPRSRMATGRTCGSTQVGEIGCDSSIWHGQMGTSSGNIGAQIQSLRSGVSMVLATRTSSSTPLPQWPPVPDAVGVRATPTA